MKNLVKSLLIGAVLAGLVQSAEAQLVTYNVSTSDDSHPSDPAQRGVLPAQQTTINSTVAPASSLTYGTGLSPNNYAFGLTFFVNSGAQFQTTLAGANMNNDYIGFTITPAAGTYLRISGLNLSHFEIESTDGSPQTYSYSVESSVGGFSAANAIKTVDFSNTGVFGTDVPLNLAVSKATSFRIYLVGGNGDDNYQTVNINDGSSISLEGHSLLVPEPGTYALFCLGLALLVVTVRSRRSAKV